MPLFKWRRQNNFRCLCSNVFNSIFYVAEQKVLCSVVGLLKLGAHFKGINFEIMVQDDLKQTYFTFHIQCFATTKYKQNLERKDTNFQHAKPLTEIFYARRNVFLSLFS